MKRTYKMDVDCATCGAKIESAIAKIDGVNSARVNFMTQKLVLDADESRLDAILKEARKVTHRIDDDCELYI